MTRYRHVPTKHPQECAWAAEQPDRREGYTYCISWGPGCVKRCERLHGKRQQAQAEKRRQASHPRKFPRPRHSSGCSWCGEPILKADGTPDARRGWHNGKHEGEPECLEAFFLHTRPENQRAHVLARDGLRCPDCGTIKGHWACFQLMDPNDPLQRRAGWFDRLYPPDVYVGQFSRISWVDGRELEHEVPLWKVAHLPDDERSVYFGPVNLKLRCPECHAIKTKREAAERAARRHAA